MTPDQDQAQFFESYLPVYDVVPDSWEDAKGFITEQLKRISNAVNVREIGWLLDQEVLSGKQFIPSNAEALLQGTAPQFRTVLRKVIDFGSVGVGTNTQPHDFTVDANFTLIDLWASFTDPVALKSFTLSYWSKDATEDLRLDIEGANIVITALSDYSSYTRVFVFCEYIQEL